MPTSLPPEEEEEIVAEDVAGSGSNADSVEAIFLDDSDEDNEPEEPEERVVIPSLVEEDEEVSKCSDVATILKLLDDRILANGANANNAPYNPVKILTR